MTFYTRRNGITLVEILTALAIIIVVLLMMMPVVVNSTRKSKEVVSKNDLRQIFLAIELYTQDHGVGPRNNIRRPEFLPYLGGRVPTPPLAPPVAQWKHEFQYDYKMYPHMVETVDLACLEKRGGDASIAHDGLWASPRVSAENRGGFYLFIRRNGSIGRFDVRKDALMLDRPGDWPCPGANSMLNW